jgi:hypothetical protein
MDEIRELMDYAQKPIYDSFDGHVVTVVLPAGGGEYPVPKFECKESSRDDSVCTPAWCQLKELYDSVGWEIFKAAGEIELAKLSAKADWRDPEEPWIEVEP